MNDEEDCDKEEHSRKNWNTFHSFSGKDGKPVEEFHQFEAIGQGYECGKPSKHVPGLLIAYNVIPLDNACQNHSAEHNKSYRGSIKLKPVATENPERESSNGQEGHNHLFVAYFA